MSTAIVSCTFLLVLVPFCRLGGDEGMQLAKNKRTGRRLLSLFVHNPDVCFSWNLSFLCTDWMQAIRSKVQCSLFLYFEKKKTIISIKVQNSFPCALGLSLTRNWYEVGFLPRLTDSFPFSHDWLLNAISATQNIRYDSDVPGSGHDDFSFSAKCSLSFTTGIGIGLA